MWQGIGIWQFLAGLGLFLFAMLQLEHGLRHLAGSRMRNLLRQSTANPVQGILVGSVATALVQSSSMVGLLILAFVGAGLLPLSNAIGLVYGTNLGTTSTGWLVLLLGFRFKLSALALPLVALGSLGVVMLQSRKDGREWSRLLLGLGLLLLGLGEMKASFEAIATQVDMATSPALSRGYYLLFGLGFTALVQSSSATMMVAMSALNAGLLGLVEGASLMVGANLGTTVTLILGALNGTATKRQVALAHILFNLATALLIWPLLPWLLSQAERAWQLNDALLSLVLFHTLFNACGVILMAPLITPLSRYLARLFVKPEPVISRYISQVPATVSEAALVAAEQESARLLHQVLHLNLRNLKIGMNKIRSSAVGEPLLEAFPGNLRFSQKYARVKSLSGELLAYIWQVQQQPLDDAQSRRLSSLYEAVRHWNYASKALKDVRKNIAQFSREGNPDLADLRSQIRQQARHFYLRLMQIYYSEPLLAAEELAQVQQEIREQYDRRTELIRQLATDGRISELELSTLLNVNRELRASNENLCTGMQAWLEFSADHDSNYRDKNNDQ